MRAVYGSIQEVPLQTDYLGSLDVSWKLPKNLSKLHPIRRYRYILLPNRAPK